MMDPTPDMAQVENVFAMMRESREESVEAVRGMFGPDVVVDEVALLFQENSAIFRFLQLAVQRPDVTLFNFSHDSVSTAPLIAKYTVQYWFLTSGDPEWRVEAMVQDGYSPLHNTLSTWSGSQSAMMPVHASFKCKDEMEYASARHTLRTAGWEEAQRCDSDYGRFSYWCHPDLTLHIPFLKPRVNLRDAR